MSEKCARCGSTGQDRRTLWMACFYEMGELKIPFEKDLLFRVNKDDDTLTIASEGVDINVPDGPPISVQAPTIRCSGELHPQHLYTLRVCKRCLGEWMAAIKVWFNATPKGEDHDSDDDVPSVGSGIFVRRNGSMQEVTREEWDRLYAGKDKL